jgi:hypothetical protein
MPTTRGGKVVDRWVCLTSRKMVSGLAFVASLLAQACTRLPASFKAHLAQGFLQTLRALHARPCQGRKAFGKDFTPTRALFTEEATDLHNQMNGPSDFLEDRVSYAGNGCARVWKRSRNRDRERLGRLHGR